MTDVGLLAILAPVAGFVLAVGLIKLTLIFGIAGLVTTALRTHSAALRTVVWSLFFVGALALPVATVMIPSWDIWEISPSLLRGELTSVEISDVETGLLSPTQIPPGERPSWNATANNWSIAGTVVMAFAITWFVVAVVLVTSVILNNLQVVRLVSRARLAPKRTRELASRCARLVRLSRVPVVYVSAELEVPGSFGFRRPVILLPTASFSWSPDRLQAVLTHESAHIKRHDFAIHLVAQVVRSLNWINPFVHVAFGRLSIERERACDDMAIRAGIGQGAYANHLVAIAKIGLLSAASRGTLAMARPSGLTERVMGILGVTVNRTPVSTRATSLGIVVALAVLVPVAAVRIFAQSTPTPQEIIRQLQSGSPSEQLHAVWRLGELETSEGTSVLVDLLRAESAELRTIAAWSLGEIKDSAAVDALTRSLDDADAFVREMAALALGELDQPKAVAALIDAAERHQDLARPVIWALGEIHSDDASAGRNRVAARFNEESRENDEVWTGRFDAAGGFDARQDVATAIADLASPVARTRLHGAFQLGMTGDIRGVDQLIHALRDPNPSVRAMAVWALDEINPSKIR